MTTHISSGPAIEWQVRKLITDTLAINESELVDDASFADDLQVDSLDVCELFAEVEKKFKFHIGDEEAEKLKTVGSLITYIKSK
jgi:acyl carrier protein